MAFAKLNLSKWNKEQIYSNSPKSDRYGFELEKKGVKNENHPFKIYLVSDTAPVITSDLPSLNPAIKNEFLMTVSINRGFVYDLSRYNDNYTQPLMVSKRKDGRFQFLSFGKREILSLAQMESMKIPVKIKDADMVEVTPGIQNGPTIDLKIKTDGEQIDFADSLNNGTGCLFLEVSFRNVEISFPNKATPISAATILTADQIRQKYGNDTTFELGNVVIKNEFQRNRTRFIQIYSPALCRFVPSNRANFKTTVSPATYSDELKKSIAAPEGPFYFAFYPIPHTDGQVLKNHLFLRIS